MTRQEMISKAQDNFLKASQEFNFEFITPAELGDGISAFGYISGYGSANGAVVDLLFPPHYHRNQELYNWCNENNYFFSSLFIEPLIGEYDRAYFRHMLRDWTLR